MSEIPFLNALGDALERGAAAAINPRHRRRWYTRRLRLAVVIAVFAAAGVASASALLSGSATTQLAANSVACYGPSGGVAVLTNDGRSPTRLCAGAPGVTLPASKLVACAAGAGQGAGHVSVYPATHRDECARRGLAPLPAAYASARGAVSALTRALVAIERSSDCVPLADFKRRAQAALERLDWRGWRVSTHGSPGEGCGALEEGGAGQPEIASSLDAADRTLTINGAPRRSLITAERAIWKALDSASGSRCLTATALERYARRQGAGRDATLAFAVTREPRFVEAGDGRQSHYEQGCAVLGAVERVPRANRLDVLIYAPGGGASAPQGGSPPPSSFRR